MRFKLQAYEIQITSNLPCGPFDIKMKKIITETRVIDCESPYKKSGADFKDINRIDNQTSVHGTLKTKAFHETIL
jgi:hypothetical protein